MSSKEYYKTDGVTIIPATEDDIPALIKIHTAAFRSDLFSILMLLNRDEDAHQNLMRKSIDHWFADPHTQIIKAVDHDTGQILGWACWALKGAESDEVEKGEGKDEGAGKQKASSQPGEANATEETPPPPPPKPETQKDPARILGGLMAKEMIKWESVHLKPLKKYWVLEALSTDPSVQGRGVGSKLVQWGIETADAVNPGLACYAHASPAGHGLYARAGFEEDDRSEFDLSEWAPGGKGGGRGWGVYVFRYMLRPAGGIVGGGRGE